MVVMLPQDGAKNSAANDFRRARRQAALQQIMAYVTGRSIDLLSFDDVYQKLKLEGMSDRGRQEIRLDAIVGSVGRYKDFTRSFLPLKDSDEARWIGVDEAMTGISGVPPIEVCQIGEAYFVVDGNHRVSVARQQGLTYIEAFVVEYKTKVPLEVHDDLKDLTIKEEYATFLDRTRLDKIRPEANLQMTLPGNYWELQTHIEAHHYLVDQEQGQEMPYEEATGHWYDTVYLPVIYAIREQGILRDFPKRTETDLYLWIFRHRAGLEEKLGWHIGLDVAAADLATEQGQTAQRLAARVEQKLHKALVPDQLEVGPAPGRWRQERAPVRRYNQLFNDILVPLSGNDDCWLALDSALEIARLEEGQIFGLHVVSSEADLNNEAARALQAEFDQRCQTAGIPGRLPIEEGKLVSKICDRARWADLIVMYPADPPGSQLRSRLASNSRNVIFGSPRPILTVPGAIARPNRILLAYDDGPKAREGLYVAAHMAIQWGVWLAVLTVIEDEADTNKLAQARDYLDSQGVTATYLPAQGDVAETIFTTADQQDSDLIVIGGYGVRPVRQAVLGSKVDRIVREARRPVLICR